MREQHHDEARRLPAVGELRDELRDEFLRIAQAESPTPTRRRLRSVVVALGALTLVVGGGAAGIIVGSDGERGTTPEPSPPPVSLGFAEYATLPQLVRASDLVIVGTVRQVTPGEVVPDEGGGNAPMRFLNTVVSVDETLKGSASATVVTKTTELAYPRTQEWREPGERIVAFLTPSRHEAGLHIATNEEQSFYLVSGDELDPAVHHESLSEEIGAMTLPELRDAIEGTSAG